MSKLKITPPILITIVFITLILITICLRFLEFYLDNHFVGMFDQYGLPRNYSRNGWSLIIDAWPIWLIPMIVIFLIILGFIILGLYFYQRQHVEIAAASEDTAAPGEFSHSHLTNIEVLNQLEIQKLKRQLDLAKQKYHEMKIQLEDKGDGSKVTQTSKPEETSREISKFQREAKQVRDEYNLLQEELNRCKSLIERLLEERLSSKFPSSEE